MTAKVLFVLLCGVSTLALMQWLELVLSRKYIRELEDREKRNIK